ncbi:MAG: thioredoxin fold domain-containing protein [Clostridia bacterium]|nr:thioredoxin fold domain-containing protein [Clostridia bacterium]
MKKGVTIALVVALLVVGFAVFRFVNSGAGSLAATPNPEERLAVALAEKRPVFIEFYADRCPACVSMKPTVTELKKKYGDKIEFILADTDGTGMGLAIDYQVMYIPAYVFINSEGERVGGDLSGYMSKEKLEGLLQALL